MIYNNPVDYKIEVTLEMFDQLLECENIQAVKESTRDSFVKRPEKNKKIKKYCIIH